MAKGKPEPEWQELTKALGKWDIVEPHYVRALAIYEKAFGLDHAAGERELL